MAHTKSSERVGEARESVKLGLCRAPCCADVSETVAMALPCQSCADVSMTVVMALPCQAVRTYRRR